MQIKHYPANFKKPAYLYKRQVDGTHSYTVGELHNWHEIEFCIAQALYENDNSYYLVINGQEIDLLDEEIFYKLKKIYPYQMTYSWMIYDIILNFRNIKKINDDEIQKFNQAFGTRFKTK